MISAALLWLLTKPESSPPSRQTILGGVSIISPFQLQPAPNKTPGTFVVFGSNGETVFLVMRKDLADKDAETPPDQFLRNAASSAARASKGTITNTLPVALKGWPGLECTLEAYGGV